MSFFDRIFSKKDKEELDKGLEKTKDGFFSKIGRAVAGKSTVSEAELDDIEEALISADVGLDTTVKIIDRLEERVARDKYINAGELADILRTEITELLAENRSVDVGAVLPPDAPTPYVLMVVGVNGVGKTTTIGKLAWQLQNDGKRVILGAADTFRAAAIDQLRIWGERSGAEVVARDMGSDPASVAFDTLQKGVSAGADVIIIDTAGRLHNKVGLMNELTKIKRVMDKVVPGAPHDVLLVLDASTGQNAIEQARQFTKATEVTGLALTKLDGTAKGGVALGIADQFRIPIRYIGVGERPEHLQVFDRRVFVDALFGENT